MATVLSNIVQVGIRPRLKEYLRKPYRRQKFSKLLEPKILSLRKLLSGWGACTGQVHYVIKTHVVDLGDHEENLEREKCLPIEKWHFQVALGRAEQSNVE